MWVSRKTDYASRALLALAMVPEDTSLKISEIGERTATPSSFLEQILLQLRSAGLVRSTCGPHGGYRLNKPPSEITLDRVVRIFEGPLAPISCATRTAPEPCEMQDGCGMRDIWTEVRDATIEILERTTFADLAAGSHGVWMPPEAAAQPVAAPGRRTSG